MIKAINHITYSVSDLRNSIKFYKDIFKATLLVEWKHLKPENRESGQFIEVLHPDFKEFGMSGKVYDRSDLD